MSYSEISYVRNYPKAVEKTCNFSNLRPLVSLLLELAGNISDGEADGLFYVNRIQQDLYDKEVLPTLKSYVPAFIEKKNAVPLQEPLRFMGIVDRDGYPFPVFSQNKLQSLGNVPTEEFNRVYLPQVQEALRPYGFTGDGISTGFSDGVRTLVDMKPENIGLTSQGKIRFFDVDMIGEH